MHTGRVARVHFLRLKVHLNLADLTGGPGIVLHTD